jgi:hypothetical protein
MAKHLVEKLRLGIPRAGLQAGFSNSEYPERMLRDSRLTHHIPTLSIMRLKNLQSAGRDSKFTDLIGPDGKFAEGKNIKKGKPLTLKPSVDTGGGRGFRQENLDQCFSKNSHYFLYETTTITETTVTFEIYWVPINIIREWYEKSGNGKGQISYVNLKKCISQCEIEQTEEIRG